MGEKVTRTNRDTGMRDSQGEAERDYDGEILMNRQMRERERNGLGTNRQRCRNVLSQREGLRVTDCHRLGLTEGRDSEG